MAESRKDDVTRDRANPSTATWPDPILGQHYVCRNGRHDGQTGQCIDTRESGFGMKWALIAFPVPVEPGHVVPPAETEWYRTVLIDSAPPPSP